MGYNWEDITYHVADKTVHGDIDKVEDRARITLTTDDKKRVSILVDGSSGKVKELLNNRDFAYPAAALLNDRILSSVGYSITVSTIVGAIHKAGAQGVTKVSINGEEEDLNAIEHWLPTPQ